jgi:hypothetical protein
MNISELIGKTILGIGGANAGSDNIVFVTNDGSYAMYHNQDCCENVTVEDITGFIEDLIGTPVLQAEESSNRDNQPSEYAESWTWTFYNIATIKGYVTIRWLGTSNGYYGESVDFKKLT